MGASEVLESLGLGFIEYDASGTVVDSNHEARRILGDDLSQRSLTDVDRVTDLYTTGGARVSWNQLPQHQTFTNSKSSGPEIFGYKTGENTVSWIKMRSASVNTHIWVEIEEVTYDKEQIDASFQNALWYKTLIDGALETLFIIDLKGRFVDVNEKACQNLGYTREELLKMSVVDIEVGLTKEQIQKIFEDFKLDQAIILEGVHRTKDGTQFPVEVRGHGLEWLGRKLMVGMAHNIADKKRAEADLKASEEKFRSLFEDHAAVKLIIDIKEGKILNANKAACEFYGYSPERINSMYIHDINILTKDEVKAEMDKSLQENRVNFHFKHRKADGSIADVDVFTSTVNWGGQKALHSIVHDVTTTSLLQERLKLLSRAVESSAVSIVITNAEGSIIYVNPFFTKVSGYSYEEALGNNPRILKSGAQSKEFYQGLWETITSGKDWTGELQNRRKDGTLYWEKSVISPIANEKGELVYFVAVKEDITMMKTYYETIELQNSTLRDIAWTQSHALRAPLVKIMGLVALLNDQDYTQLSREQILDSILATSNEIDQTIRYIADRTENVRIFGANGDTSGS